jgi:hypothetical protein
VKKWGRPPMNCINRNLKRLRLLLLWKKTPKLKPVADFVGATILLLKILV